MSAFSEEEESYTRLAAIEQRLTVLESKLAALATANSSEVAKVKQSLLNNKVFNYR